MVMGTMLMDMPGLRNRLGRVSTSKGIKVLDSHNDLFDLAFLILFNCSVRVGVSRLRQTPWLFINVNIVVIAG